MKEKIKKHLIISAYKMAFAAGIFIILFITGLFASGFIEKLSPIWSKSIDIKRAGELFSELMREVFPF